MKLMVDTGLATQTYLCHEAIGLSLHRYVPLTYQLLGSMARKGVGTSAQLDLLDGSVAFPSLQDEDTDFDTMLSFNGSYEFQTKLEIDSTRRHSTPQARLRRSLRLANFMVEHGAHPYADVTYRDKSFRFIW